MIRMSKLTDYAILLLAHLARSTGTLTAHELAERSHVPLPTVSKLAKELSKAGLVISHRGRNGGSGLARPAEQISVAENVESLEGPISLTECGRPGATGCEIVDTRAPVQQGLVEAFGYSIVDHLTRRYHSLVEHGRHGRSNRGCVG